MIWSECVTICWLCRGHSPVCHGFFTKRLWFSSLERVVGIDRFYRWLVEASSWDSKSKKKISVADNHEQKPKRTQNNANHFWNAVSRARATRTRTIQNKFRLQNISIQVWSGVHCFFPRFARTRVSQACCLDFAMGCKWALWPGRSGRVEGHRFAALFAGARQQGGGEPAGEVKYPRETQMRSIKTL